MTSNSSHFDLNIFSIENNNIIERIKNYLKDKYIKDFFFS